MERIDFRHGGPDYDRRYPDGIPTTVDIEHATLGQLSSGLVMYPEGHARSANADLTCLLGTQVPLAAGLGVDDTARLVARFTNLTRKSPARNRGSLQLPEFAASAIVRELADDRTASRPSTNRGDRASSECSSPCDTWSPCGGRP